MALLRHPQIPLQINLQVGAEKTEGDSIQEITVSIKSMTAAGLGIDGLKRTTTPGENEGADPVTSGGISDADGALAKEAIETIKNAITTLNEQRADLGAQQNRLEHTISNLDNVVENTTAAESQIRDTDMATEMVKFSNNNILAQAGQSMLAQANQSNQGVLSLLG